MSDGESAPGISLGAYVAVLRRSWWLVLASTLLGLIASLIYLAVVPQEASARASVVVNVISADPFNASRAASGLIDSAGEVQIASSYAVAERAAEQLGGDFTPDSVRRSVNAAAVGDTAILRFTAVAPSAQEAQNLANAVAGEYLEFRSEEAQARISRAIDQADQRLEGLQAELQAVDQRIADAAPGSRELTAAQSDRSLLTLQINAVLSQAASTEIIDTQGGSMLSPADRNPVTWTPRTGLVIMTGVLAGFGLGLIAAFALNAFTSRIKTERDVRQHGGGTLLGEMALERSSVPPRGNDLSEFRSVRERLLADWRLETRVGALAVLDVVGVRDDQQIALNLAYVIAQSGVPAEYVELVTTEGRLSELKSSLGLALHPDQPVGGVRLLAKSNPGFTLLLPDGANAARGEEPLSPAMRTEIERRRAEVLVVLPLSRTTGEATRLASARIADFAMVVTVRGVTRADDLKRASEEVQDMGASLLGSVLVDRRSAKRGRTGSDGESVAAAGEAFDSDDVDAVPAVAEGVPAFEWTPIHSE